MTAGVVLSKQPWWVKKKVDMHIYTYNIYVLLPLLLLCYGGVASIHCSRVDENNNQDLRALLDFKQGVTSDPYGALSNWTMNSHFCRWNGVTCTLTPPYRVSELILYNQSLSGQISSSLGNLTFLEYLDLSENIFAGALPLLGRLQQLQTLYLNYNNLSGTILDALTNCSNLIDLDLSSNLLVGSVTPKLGLLSNLEYLALSSNQLEGRIPHELGQLVKLEALILRNNKHSGEVPYGIFSLSRLQYLHLGSNMLVGKALPPNIGQLLPNLKQLLLENNTFEGAIPASLGNALGLEEIDLSRNNFTGQIPTTFGKLLNLTILNLRYNHLVARNNKGWAFLSALRSCRSLEVLALSYNELQGPIPQSIYNLSANLRFLWLAGNNLSGQIPRFIGNLSSLFSINLGENHFSGTIEGLMDNLTQLQYLNLRGNELEGLIPASLGNHPGLQQLYLNDNNLQGYIP